MITEKIINKASKMASEFDRISVSYFQRTLSLPYFEAVKLMDELEKRGVVGKADGAKPREVLNKAKELKQIKFNDFWSFVVLMIFAIGAGILLNIIIILIKR